MRIIAGELKGRRAQLPPGVSARPTPEKVREALFSMLGSDLGGLAVLDLFAGGGGVGLEALSRGAAFVTMADMDQRIVHYLKDTLQAFKVDPARWEVLQGDYQKTLDRLRNLGRRYDVIYLDPPYAAGYYEPALTFMAEHLMAEDCWILAEHDVPLPEAIAGLRATRERRYGTVYLTLYEKEG